MNEKDPITLAIDALEEINDMACYASEEDVDSRESMLLKIGEKSRSTLRALQSQPAAAHGVDGLAKMVLDMDAKAKEMGLCVGAGRDAMLPEDQQEGPMWKAIKAEANRLYAQSKQPQINTHKLNIHILLDALSCAAKGEPIDPEQCEVVAGIAKEYSATDFTADDIQALYDCGPKLSPADKQVVLSELQISNIVKHAHDAGKRGVDWVDYEPHNDYPKLVNFSQTPLPVDKQAALDALKDAEDDSITQGSYGFCDSELADEVYRHFPTIRVALTAPQPVADLDGLRELKRETYNAVFKEGESRILNGIDFANLCLVIDHLHATGRLTTSADVQELKDAVMGLYAIIEEVNDARHAQNAGPKIGGTVPDYVDKSIDDAVIELEKHAPTIAKIMGE